MHPAIEKIAATKIKLTTVESEQIFELPVDILFSISCPQESARILGIHSLTDQAAAVTSLMLFSLT
jgi:hypothetical protein